LVGDGVEKRATLDLPPVAETVPVKDSAGFSEFTKLDHVPIRDVQHVGVVFNL
jgi:hypothetical protein